MKLEIFEMKGLGWALNCGEKYQVVMTYEEIEKRLKGEGTPIEKMSAKEMA